MIKKIGFPTQNYAISKRTWWKHKTFEADVALGDVSRVVDFALVEAGVLVPRIQDGQRAVAQDALLNGELSRLLLH